MKFIVWKVPVGSVESCAPAKSHTASSCCTCLWVTLRWLVNCRLSVFLLSDGCLYSLVRWLPRMVALYHPSDGILFPPLRWLVNATHRWLFMFTCQMVAQYYLSAVSQMTTCWYFLVLSCIRFSWYLVNCKIQILLPSVTLSDNHYLSHLLCLPLSNNRQLLPPQSQPYLSLSVISQIVTILKCHMVIPSSVTTTSATICSSQMVTTFQCQMVQALRPASW